MPAGAAGPSQELTAALLPVANADGSTAVGEHNRHDGVAPYRSKKMATLLNPAPKGFMPDPGSEKSSATTWPAPGRAAAATARPAAASMSAASGTCPGAGRPAASEPAPGARNPSVIPKG